MFKFAPGSLGFDVGMRRYGKQDCGITPQGASDQLSFEVARILLGEPSDFRCSEIIIASTVTFTESVTFVVTGAHYKRILLNGREIAAHTVHKAEAGDELTFDTLQLGLRVYLMATAACPVNGSRIGKSRGSYEQWFGTVPKSIRVFEGPEHRLLKESESFLHQNWTITADSNRMGIRLDGETITADAYDIVSSAVDDGTVQLTSSGPIVLMRERQTTGGYPRIFQVAAVDIDLLAQYPVGAHVTFEQITLDQSKQLLHERLRHLEAFRNAMA
jgi:allophanate hydrolase subunit 2